ncbi:myosin IC heavy chain-like [Macaca nemestrina]|uniref:myosin IC heavy chain-like n=1 Tax=Macaca nemestrina TaxID=9545 RepID=UPI0039B938DE
MRGSLAGAVGVGWGGAGPEPRPRLQPRFHGDRSLRLPAAAPAPPGCEASGTASSASTIRTVVLPDRVLQQLPSGGGGPEWVRGCEARVRQCARCVCSQVRLCVARVRMRARPTPRTRGSGLQASRDGGAPARGSQPAVQGVSEAGSGQKAGRGAAPEPPATGAGAGPQVAGEGVEAEAAARPLPSAGLRRPRSAAAFESAGQPRPPAAPGAGGCGGARGGGAGPSGIRSHTLLCPPHKPSCAHPQRDAAFQVGGRMRKRVCDVTSSRASVDFRLRACTPAPAIHLSIHTASLTRAPTHLPSASHASPCPRDRSWALPPCQNAAGGAQGTRRRCRHSADASRPVSVAMHTRDDVNWPSEELELKFGSKGTPEAKLLLAGS